MKLISAMAAETPVIQPALKRTNLNVWTHAHVQKLRIEDKHLVGLEVIHKGKMQRISARKEVILCAGAVANLKLLQLSGVGDPALLQKHNIEVKHVLPAVGQNL